MICSSITFDNTMQPSIEYCVSMYKCIDTRVLLSAHSPLYSSIAPPIPGERSTLQYHYLVDEKKNREDPPMRNEDMVAR
jgi:hypothetical protein